MTQALAFKPKNVNGVLRVLIIGRISTEHQNIENIDASYRYVEDYLRQVYDGATELRHLGERASGMLAERDTIREACDLIETGEWDLVIAEDLSRIFRNPRHQYNFVQDAVDAQTRLICIADNLDTADDNWELMLGAATLRHGLMVSDTRRRVRRTATHSFHNGGMVQKVRFGYRKLAKQEADSGHFGPKGLTVTKISECTPIIREMARRVISGATYVAVAEWLGQEGIKPPQYVVTGRWSGRVVKDLLADPILVGVRTFRETICEPVYRTGRHRRRKNDSPETAQVPELAHLEHDQHCQLIEVMNRREASHRRSSGREHPLQGRSRKRSLWPAQHARCVVCGDMLYRYDRKVLKCRNANRSAGHTCWNRVQVNSEIATHILLTGLFQQLCDQDGFLEALQSAAHTEFARSRELKHRRELPDTDRLEDLQRQSANLTEAIVAGGQIAQLVDRLTQVTAGIQEIQSRSETQQQSTRGVSNAIAARIDAEPLQVLLDTAAESFELADLIRAVCPVFDIVPVQALDTPQIRPMARLRCELISNTGTVDQIDLEKWLFEPPLHIRHLDECLRLKAEHPRDSLKTIASRAGLNHMTVKRAFDYARRMDQAGVTTPFQILTSKPANASRWKNRVDCTA